MKKKEVMPFATTCMNLGSIMLNEKDQMEKDKYCMESCICGNGFKKKKKEFLETESKWWLPRAGAGRNRQMVKGYKLSVVYKNQVFIRTCNIWSFNVQWVIIVNNTEIC